MVEDLAADVGLDVGKTSERKRKGKHEMVLPRYVYTRYNRRSRHRDNHQGTCIGCWTQNVLVQLFCIFMIRCSILVRVERLSLNNSSCKRR